MNTSYDIIKTLLRTEKSTGLEKTRQYVFEVASGSAKPEIRKAVEDIYKVKVQSVNITIVPGKRKRVRQRLGHTSEWKKAIVTLKVGSKIEVA
jgi:large subunit ribosomal protein L23